MLQQLMVTVIVALAVVYAAWRWMPAAWRRAVAQRLARGSQRAGLIDGQQAERMAASLAKTSGCGACDSCGQCAPRATGVRQQQASELRQR